MFYFAEIQELGRVARGRWGMPESEALHASHRLEYPYSCSVGPVIGAFLTGLRDGR